MQTHSPAVSGQSKAVARTAIKSRKRKLLAYNDKARLPFHRLPFIKFKRADPCPFWCVPATGGYEGGWQTGAALGDAYIRFYANRGELHPYGSWLGMVVLNMAERLATAGAVSDDEHSPELSSLRGQILGFMERIDRMVAYAAKDHRGHFVTRMAESDLVARANEGLVHGEAET